MSMNACEVLQFAGVVNKLAFSANSLHYSLIAQGREGTTVRGTANMKLQRCEGCEE
jgi:hypothetical protein